MAKTQSKRKPEVQTETYLIEIEDWDASYSFSIGKGMAHKHGPYWEHVSLIIHGHFIHPEKVLDKTIKMTVMGKRNEDDALNDPDGDYQEPRCVGSLTVRGDRREYLGTIPQTALWGLMPMLEAGRIKFVDLHGELLRYGSALIWSISFERNIDPEEY